MLPILAVIAAVLIGYIIVRLAFLDPRAERLHRAAERAELDAAKARLARQARAIKRLHPDVTR